MVSHQMSSCFTPYFKLFQMKFQIVSHLIRNFRFYFFSNFKLFHTTFQVVSCLIWNFRLFYTYFQISSYFMPQVVSPPPMGWRLWLWVQKPTRLQCAAHEWYEWIPPPWTPFLSIMVMDKFHHFLSEWTFFWRHNHWFLQHFKWLKFSFIFAFPRPQESRWQSLATTREASGARWRTVLGTWDGCPATTSPPSTAWTSSPGTMASSPATPPSTCWAAASMVAFWCERVRAAQGNGQYQFASKAGFTTTGSLRMMGR